MSPSAVYQSSLIKRARRSKGDIRTLREALYTLVAQSPPVTVRQAFYMATIAGLVPKTEAAYKNTVCRLLALMRREQELPFNWIADNTRWMRKPTSYNSLEDALSATARLYRRNLWQSQETYVEIWLEKDALAGVLLDVTAQWDVPLMVTKGYASLSYLYEAATALQGLHKAIHLYYFGDHDPSGRDIPRKVEADLRTFAPTSDISFTRVAVEPWQITAWNLPTRPTKRSDSRSKTFEGESVEVDAIPPDDLRRLARECIEPHIDYQALHLLDVAEREERKLLQLLNPTALAQLQREGT